jgi:16S rRNA (adenine1518-N6/adenine1519-N6)-dimethyltransferase
MRASEVRNLLAQVGVRPDRDLGQSFLVNDSIARRIAAEASSSGSVMEIGPGLGALTGLLLPLCGSLTAVEISEAMAAYLSGRFAGTGLRIICEDVLEVVPESLPGYPFEGIAGNLPYSVSSPVLFRLLEKGFESVQKAVLMLQREVADRLHAEEGGRRSGRLALQIWPYFTVSDLLDAAPEDFHPAPAVHSRVVVLSRRTASLVPPELAEAYRRAVRVSLSSRRKTMLNNLTALLGRERAREVLSRAGIAPGLRAEQLQPESFIRLAEVLA